MFTVLLSAVFLGAGGAADLSAPATEIAAACKEFLGTLAPEQRAKAVLPFNDDRRWDWHYFPREREGISFNDMDETQSASGLALLRVLLSASGYERLEQLRHLEDVLKAMENGNPGRDLKAYNFAVFGEPTASGAWALTYEGHHVSMHWTLVDGKAITSFPQFLGSNPAEVQDGPSKGMRPLGPTEDLGRALVKSLGAEQRPKAVISETAPRDILSGTAREAIITEHLGIGYGELTPEQQGMLMDLVRFLADIQRPELAKERLERVRAGGLDTIKFAWLGGMEKGEPHYYRIQGAGFLIEYDNIQNNANHIHTVWRDFHGDFGADLLKEHYKDHAHDDAHGHKH